MDTKLMEENRAGQERTAFHKIETHQYENSTQLTESLIKDSIKLPIEQSPAEQVSYRYLIVSIFLISNLFNSMLINVFAPILPEVQNYYGISSTYAASCSFIFMIGFLIGNFPANYILDRDLKKGLILAQVLIIIGVWIRLFVNQNFVFVIIGQFIASLGTTFFTNAPSKVSAQWFPESQRTLPTALMAISSPIGGGFGFLFPTLIVNSYGSQDEYAQGRLEVKRLLLIEGLLITSFSLLFCILYKERRAASQQSEIFDEVRNKPFKEQLSDLIHNKNFLLLLYFFSIAYGNFQCLIIIISLILEPYNVGSDIVGVSGMLMVLCGLAGSIIMGARVQKNQKFRKTLSYLIFLYAGGYFFFIIGLSYKIHYLYYFACILVGFSIFPILPLSFEYACKLTAPLGEALTCGTLFNGAILYSTIKANIFTNFVDNENRELVTLWNILTLCLSLLAVIFLQSIEQKEKFTIH